MDTFPTTHWSFVTNLRDASGEDRAVLVASFMQRYIPALRSFLCLQFPRLQSHDVDDLLQQFVADRLIKRQILDAAHHDRGRLRAFLKTCLHNFARTWLARQRRDALVSLDDPATVIGEAGGVGGGASGSSKPPPCSFDRLWAHQVLADAIIRFKDDCHSTGRQLMWDVFDFRMVRPSITHEPPVPYTELSRRWGVDARRLENLLTTAKRRVREEMLEIVEDYATPGEEAEGEVNDLFRILAQPSDGATD